MDENTNPTTKSDINQPAVSADVQQGGDDKQAISPERVYDFTSDLNISPVTSTSDEPEPAKTPTPIIETGATLVAAQKAPSELQNAIGRLNINPEIRDTINRTNIRDVPKPTFQDIEDHRKPIKEETSNPQVGEKALRTYETDIAEALARKKTSVASIAIAEDKRREQEKKEQIVQKPVAEKKVVEKQIPPEQKEQIIPIKEKIQVEEKPPIYGTDEPERSRSGVKMFMLFVSMIFILGGIITAYYLYDNSPVSKKVPVITPTTEVKKLLTADSQVKLAIDNLSASEILNKIQNEVNKTQAPDTIKEIIITQKQNGTALQLTGPQILKVMNIATPTGLTRSLTNDWVLGVYNDKDNNKGVFVIATNNFFGNAFSSMIAWENTMIPDLKTFLMVPPQTLATTTGTSTLTAAQLYPTIRGQFVDGLVSNKDTREFYTADNNVIFLYSFVDQQKLVLTGSEAVLAKVVARLEQQSYVR